MHEYIDIKQSRKQTLEQEILLRIKRTWRAHTKENTLVLIAVDTGGKNIQEQDQSLSCPHSRSRDQCSVREHPREARWTVTPREGKDPESSDLRKTFIIYYSFILTCSVGSFGLLSFSFFLHFFTLLLQLLILLALWNLSL